MNSAFSVVTVLAVAGGGAVGSVARYLVTVAMTATATAFPYATLVVNVVGAFLIGLFARLFATPDHDPVLRLALTTGLCGGFTTFSTFEYETRRLAEAGLHGLALLNVTASVAAGYAAVTLGARLAR